MNDFLIEVQKDQRDGVFILTECPRGKQHLGAHKKISLRCQFYMSKVWLWHIQIRKNEVATTSNKKVTNFWKMELPRDAKIENKSYWPNTLSYEKLCLKWKKGMDMSYFLIKEKKFHHLKILKNQQKTNILGPFLKIHSKFSCG